MKCSICIAVYDKSEHLGKTLDSIFQQSPPFNFEVIVVDDGSPRDDVSRVCAVYPVSYTHISRAPAYRNPAKARNVAYRKAVGDIIICQSDDVLHHRENCVEQLVNELHPNSFVIGTVVNVDINGRPYCDPNGAGYGDKLIEYTSPKRRRPLFFLGALYRKDLYAVGGNDEDFTAPSGEDQWFALCLTRGAGLIPFYSSEVVGHHQHHLHTTDYAGIRKSQRLLRQKTRDASEGRIAWIANGGAWT